MNTNSIRVFSNPQRGGNARDPQRETPPFKAGGDHWPIVPRLVDLSLVEFRVLRLICSGYGLAKEIVNGYSSKFNEPISLPAVERTLAKLRGKGLINSKPVSKALMHEATTLGRLIACS